jgi:hypothetical protein
MFAAVGAMAIQTTACTARNAFRYTNVYIYTYIYVSFFSSLKLVIDRTDCFVVDRSPSVHGEPVPFRAHDDVDVHPAIPVGARPTASLTLHALKRKARREGTRENLVN